MLSKRKLKEKVRVIFTLSAQAGGEAVYLVGDFNNWDRHATAMARNKDGNWEAKVDLDSNREYQFRYLVNDRLWRGDPDADGYVRSPFGSNNCVVSTVIASRTRRRGTKKAD